MTTYGPAGAAAGRAVDFWSVPGDQSVLCLLLLLPLSSMESGLRSPPDTGQAMERGAHASLLVFFFGSLQKQAEATQQPASLTGQPEQLFSQQTLVFPRFPVFADIDDSSDARRWITQLAIKPSRLYYTFLPFLRVYAGYTVIQAHLHHLRSHGRTHESRMAASVVFPATWVVCLHSHPHPSVIPTHRSFLLARLVGGPAPNPAVRGLDAPDKTSMDRLEAPDSDTFSRTK